MQRTWNYPPFDTSTETNSQFNVVIAYEDFDTGTHAKKTYDFLVQNLSQECQFSNQMWKFDVLSVPRLREMAAKDALMADIIMVSSHGIGELPLGVKAWVESWVSEPGNASALVALFDGDPGEDTGAVRDYLAGVAARGRLEFFAQPDDWPGNGSSLAGFARHERVHLPKVPFYTIAGGIPVDMSFPRWGINE